MHKVGGRYIYGVCCPILTPKGWFWLGIKYCCCWCCICCTLFPLLSTVVLHIHIAVEAYMLKYPLEDQLFPLLFALPLYLLIVNSWITILLRKTIITRTGFVPLPRPLMVVLSCCRLLCWMLVSFVVALLIALLTVSNLPAFNAVRKLKGGS